jgi:HlyD family secretion protein
MLEQLVRDCASAPAVSSPGEYPRVQLLPVEVSLKVAGDKRAYVCHSFTVTLAAAGVNAGSTPPLQTDSYGNGTHSNRVECAAPSVLEISDSGAIASGTMTQDSSKELSPVPDSPSKVADLEDRPFMLAASEENQSRSFQIFSKVNPWIAGAVLAASLSGGVSYYAFSQASPSPPPAPAPSIAPITTVTALGRIEPKGEIIKLSVANAQDSRVEQLLVEEGDRVEAGQVIAILQGLDKKNAALTEAEQNVAIARARLAQVQSGTAKSNELAAQQSNIARLEAQLRTETTEKQAEIARVESELRNAEETYERYQMLYQSGATSLSEVEKTQKNLETVQAQLTIAQAQLDNTTATLQQQIQQEQFQLSNLSEVRPVDVQVAQAELNYALTQVEKAKAELEDLYVRVPIAGQILKINTRIGEQVNTNNGIVELGQTDQMYAIAEVYETDVGKIQAGQPATIVSENGGFKGEVHGTVEQIGLQIGKNNILNSDPAAEQDARVVEVKIRIAPEHTSTIAGLTNMQVRVRIDLTEAAAVKSP